MLKKNIKFSSNKVTIQGDEVSAEGVPVRDIVESIGEADAVEHLNKELLLSEIGKDAAIAWLECQGYQVI
ncbi:hypothetical protein CTH30272_02140 [Allocatenococcus thiocycli]|nr:hypothetical protein CTH30272_02140 [Catenococcus thiocycli]